MLDSPVIGEPSWAKTERFDIDAKPEGGARVLPGPQIRTMVQSMLEDFFQLKIHRETRELPVYNLTLNKKGPKLSLDQTPPEPRDAFIAIATEGEPMSALPRGALRMVMGPTASVLTGKAVSISTIISLLRGKSDRIIVDQTGFNGLIDIQIEFRSDSASAPVTAAVVRPLEAEISSPDQFTASLFTVIQESGLKLASGKAPLDVLVIDSVQRPAEN
jgi:uncharacterized protein (TIGR03435 family)